MEYSRRFWSITGWWSLAVWAVSSKPMCNVSVVVDHVEDDFDVGYDVRGRVVTFWLKNLTDKFIYITSARSEDTSSEIYYSLDPIAPGANTIPFVRICCDDSFQFSQNLTTIFLSDGSHVEIVCNKSTSDAII